MPKMLEEYKAYNPAKELRASISYGSYTGVSQCIF